MVPSTDKSFFSSAWELVVLEAVAIMVKMSVKKW
jgi:hypothetical protein